MPRPATKPDVLEEMAGERAALDQLIAATSTERLVSPGALENWSVKDTLMHLVEWEQMFLGWYRAGRAGQTPVTPAEGYNWRQLSFLNQAIYEKYRDLSLEEVLARFQSSYLEFRQTIEEMTPEEVSMPGVYAWAGGRALAGGISANSGNHYRWARKELAKGLKKLGSRSK